MAAKKKTTQTSAGSTGKEGQKEMKKASSSKKSSSRKKQASVKRDTPAARRPITADMVRDDSDASVGHFVDVVEGEHKGRYGVLIDFADYDRKTGFPNKAIVRTRDKDTARIVVDYESLRPAEAGGRR